VCSSVLRRGKVTTVQGLDSLTVKMTPLRSFKTSLSPDQSTGRNISEDLELQRRGAFECKVFRRKFEETSNRRQEKKNL